MTYGVHLGHMTYAWFSMQKSFSFVVRDSLINIGPIKDFSYGLRINADHDAAGLAKQSNYELVSVSILYFFCLKIQFPCVFCYA